MRVRLLFSLLAVLVVTLLLINTLSRELTRNYVLSRLEQDANSLIAALEPQTDGSLKLDEQRIPDLYRRALSGYYYQIRLPDDTLRSRSLWDLPLTDALTNRRIIPPDALVPDQLLLTFRKEVSIRGQKVSLWVAEDIHPLAHQIREFNLSVLAFLLVAFGILWWLQGRSLRHSFRFFEQLRQRVQSLHQGADQDTGFKPPREIRPLSDEINRLIDQLGQRTERSRSALGNFAHELKRPLQQLKLLEAELRSQNDGTDDTQQQMQDALNQIQYLLDRELKRARIAGRCLPGHSFFPADDIPPLLQMMTRIYPAIRFDAHLPESLSATDNGLPLDRDDLLELLGNLLDNAAKYARTEVQIQLIQTQNDEQSGKVLQIQIEDDGTGVDQALIQELTQRGIKLDENIAGHGLGLSICQAICDSYKGTLHFSQAEMGGLCVVATFPLSC